MEIIDTLTLLALMYMVRFIAAMPAIYAGVVFVKWAWYH
jgi:hypothetical protein